MTPVEHFNCGLTAVIGLWLLVLVFLAGALVACHFHPDRKR